MKFSIKICGFLYLLWTLTISSLIFIGKLTFGHGIGDIVYLILLVLLLLVFGYFIYRNEKLNRPIILIVFMLVSVLLIGLKITIWRGSEYPWNGELFLH